MGVVEKELELDRLKALRTALSHYRETVDSLIADLEGEAPSFRSAEERPTRLRAIARRYLTDITAIHIQAVDAPVQDLPVYLAEASAAICDAVLSSTADFYVKGSKPADGVW